MTAPILLLVAFALAALLAGSLLFSRLRTGHREVRNRLTLLELGRIRSEDAPDVLKKEILSDVPLANRVLAKIPLLPRLDRRLAQAGTRMRVGTFLLLCALLSALGFLGGALLHWPFAVTAAVGVLLPLAPNGWVNARRKARGAKFLSQFPDALEMFARSLRAGHAFTGALQLVGQEMPDPVGPEFRRVFEEQNLGIPLRQALLDLAERVAILDVRFFVTAVLIQRDTGGNLAEIVDKISHVVRERFRIQGQLRIHTAQARMTGILLALLPLGVALAIGMLNPEFLKPLWSDRIGQFLVALAVVMQAAGAVVIRRIIRIKI